MEGTNTMSVGHTIRDTAIRAVVSMAVRRGIQSGLRLVRGAIGTHACHREALTLLREWVAWAPVASAPVPGELLLKTVAMVREHSPSSGVDVDSVILSEMLRHAKNSGGATKDRPASEQPVSTDGSTTGG